MSIDGDLQLNAQSPSPARSDSDSAEVRREEGRPLTDAVAPMEISTYSEDEGSVNGRAVTKGVHPTIHDACIALTVPYALQSGGPVLIHAIDTIGTPTEFWLHVHPDGRATPAASPASTQRSAGNVSDQPPQSAAAVAATAATDTAATGEPGVGAAAAEAHVVKPAVIHEAVVNEAATGRTRASRRHAATESESGDPASVAPPIFAPSSASAVTPEPAGPALAPSPAPLKVAPELPAFRPWTICWRLGRHCHRDRPNWVGGPRFAGRPAA